MGVALIGFLMIVGLIVCMEKAVRAIDGIISRFR
jgi:hypothetical protein